MRALLALLGVVPAAAALSGRRDALRAAGPAPAPAPITVAHIVGKMKGKLAKKLDNGFDADYVIDRPTTIDGSVKLVKGPMPPSTPHDIAPDKGFPPPGEPGPGPGPAPAPAPSPGPGPDIPNSWSPFTESSLPEEVNHNDMETSLGDWRLEFGPHGPQYGKHSAYQTGNTGAHFGQPHHFIKNHA